MEPIEFCFTDEPEDVISVPAGFVMPRILRAICPPHRRYARAAIIHDWIYDSEPRKKEVDRIFLDALKVLKSRGLMYSAIWVFGKEIYRSERTIRP